MSSKKEDRSVWAIGGMTMVGFGVGIIFVKVSALIMVGSIIIGIGLGLVITAVISRKNN